jgi:hypothetical protein
VLDSLSVILAWNRTGQRRFEFNQPAVERHRLGEQITHQKFEQRVFLHGDRVGGAQHFDQLVGWKRKSAGCRTLDPFDPL